MVFNYKIFANFSHQHFALV